MRVYKQQEKDAALQNKVERVEASVKWYRPEKGYGFLIGEGHAPDIMIHFSTLDKVGCAYISPGDRVICDVAYGQSGAQVVRVIEVMFGSPVLSNLEEREGVIKWYNPEKGYGFIHSDQGREIFLHASVLRAAGYKILQPGLRVLAKVSQSEKGPIAQTIKVIYKNKHEKE